MGTINRRMNLRRLIPSALREAGHVLPVLFSYDFSAEPKRWAHLSDRYAPLAYLSDNEGPDEVRKALRALSVAVLQ